MSRPSKNNLAAVVGTLLLLALIAKAIHHVKCRENCCEDGDCCEGENCCRNGSCCSAGEDCCAPSNDQPPVETDAEQPLAD